MNRRIVITGLGVVSAFGLTTEEFWQGISHGRCAIKPLPLTEGIKITLGATIPDYDAEKLFSAEQLPLLDRFSQLSILAAEQAAFDAGFTNKDALTHAAAIIGNGAGSKNTDEEVYKNVYKYNRKRVHPLSIPKGMHSAVASSVSKRLGIKGPVFSVSSACSSGAHAIIQGSLMIQQGLVDVALVGGTDAPFPYVLLKAWEAMRVVSDDFCHPFCKDRNGISLGEGAGVLVLESEEHAEQRGAHIYAELAGYGMSSDAGHITRPDVDGISRAMQNALQSAGITASDIDYINAHGTGTQSNDLAETQAIHQVFGEHAKNLAVSSTKSMHGHALGASSAIELVATALSMKHNIVPPTVNFTQADENCDLDYVPNIPRQKNIRFAMSNSFAFGGLNVAIVLKSR
jgi:nodulation protein E